MTDLRDQIADEIPGVQRRKIRMVYEFEMVLLNRTPAEALECAGAFLDDCDEVLNRVVARVGRSSQCAMRVLDCHGQSDSTPTLP